MVGRGGGGEEDIEKEESSAAAPSVSPEKRKRGRRIVNLISRAKSKGTGLLSRTHSKDEAEKVASTKSAAEENEMLQQQEQQIDLENKNDIDRSLKRVEMSEIVEQTAAIEARELLLPHTAATTKATASTKESPSAPDPSPLLPPLPPPPPPIICAEPSPGRRMNIKKLIELIKAQHEQQKRIQLPSILQLVDDDKEKEKNTIDLSFASPPKTAVKAANNAPTSSPCLPSTTTPATGTTNTTTIVTVFLFFGASGAGKTTTLLHLAGVEFGEREDPDGNHHLQPIHYPSSPSQDGCETTCAYNKNNNNETKNETERSKNDYDNNNSNHEIVSLRDFATGSGGDSVTTNVQTYTLVMERSVSQQPPSSTVSSTTETKPAKAKGIATIKAKLTNNRSSSASKTSDEGNDVSDSFDDSFNSDDDSSVFISVTEEVGGEEIAKTIEDEDHNTNIKNNSHTNKSDLKKQHQQQEEQQEKIVDVVVLCDGPGLDDTRSIEQEIAQHVGWMQTIHQLSAQIKLSNNNQNGSNKKPILCIVPLVVLSADSVGARYQEWQRTLEHIAQLNNSCFFDSFQYVFTKVPPKEAIKWKRNRIPKILKKIQKRVQSGTKLEDKTNGERLAALLQDMVRKTRLGDGPIIVEPLLGQHHLQSTTSCSTAGQDVLDRLLSFNDSSSSANPPSWWFQSRLSPLTTNALQMEFQLLVQDVEQGMNCEEYDTTCKTSLQKLFQLQALLSPPPPQKKSLPKQQQQKQHADHLFADTVALSTYVRYAREAVIRAVTGYLADFQRSLTRLNALKKEAPQDLPALVGTLQQIRRFLRRLVQSNELYIECVSPPPLSSSSPKSKITTEDRLETIANLLRPILNLVVGQVLMTQLLPLITDSDDDMDDQNSGTTPKFNATAAAAAIDTFLTHQMYLRWNLTCLFGLKNILTTETTITKTTFLDGGFRRKVTTISASGAGEFATKSYKEALDELRLVVDFFLGASEEMVTETSSSSVGGSSVLESLPPSSHSKSPSSLAFYPFDLLNHIMTFLLDIEEDLRQKFYIDDETADDAFGGWMSQRMITVRHEFERMTRDHFDNLSQTSDILKKSLTRRARWSPISLMITLDCNSLGASREFLLALAKAPESSACNTILHSQLKGHNAALLVSEFDSLIFNYLEEVRNFAANKSRATAASAGSSSSLTADIGGVKTNPRSAIANVMLTNEALQKSIDVCTSIEYSWSSFDKDEIKELKKLMKATQFKRKFNYAGANIIGAAASVFPGST